MTTSVSEHRPRVLLVSMPFGALGRPSLGLGLLQARLVRDGVPCDTRYLTFRFAEFVGVDDYSWVAGQLPYTAFAGDWTFTASLYGARRDADVRYVDEVLRTEWQLDEESIHRLLRVRAYCEPFLAHCLDTIAWNDYDVIGFTSTFEQNIASLALARRVKAAHPHVTVVFGGANWEGEMGEELHRRFPFVDVVCSGEADESLPALVAALGTGSGRLDHVPGLVWRDGAATVSTGPARLVHDLDGLPVPDFSSYFRDLDASSAGSAVTPTLLFETARGCWWGAHSHCTFCGLNGGTMAFRSKSPGRALDEVRELLRRHGIPQFNVADNILDMRYFRTFLPMVAEADLGVRLFYEVKANLSHGQVRQLRAAGVDEIQPGIESMNDHILELMRKGTTTLRNVQLLKWCREFGIRADWNVLYGFPGETDQDYTDMLEVLRAISFLDPPTAYGPIRLDRFSPYHDDPAGFGITNVRPLAAYPFLYPFDGASVQRIAAYFAFDYAEAVHRPATVAPVIDFVRSWMAGDRPGPLWQTDAADGGLVVVDDRAGRRVTRLAGWEAAVFRACDRAQPLDEILALAAGLDVGDAAVVAFLDRCCAGRLMLTEHRVYLSLPIHVPARTAPSADARTLRTIRVSSAGVAS